MSSEGDVWRRIVEPEEYDAHMAAVGQAQANAGLVAEALVALGIGPDAAVCFVGAGTGQLLDYIEPASLHGLRLRFTDISARFLETLRARAERIGLTCDIALDDVTEARERPPCDLAVLVLVLEHVDWRLAVGRLAEWRCPRVLVVTQVNPPGLATNVSPHRVLPPSLVEGMLHSNSHLVKTAELDACFAAAGYRVEWERQVDVPDAKAMRAAVYSR